MIFSRSQVLSTFQDISDNEHLTEVLVTEDFLFHILKYGTIFLFFFCLYFQRVTETKFI